MSSPASNPAVSHINGDAKSKPDHKHKSKIRPSREPRPIPQAHPADDHLEAAAEIKIEDVMKEICKHEKQSMPIDFETISRYGVSESDAKLLWEKEAKRLISVVENPDKPLIYEDQSFGDISIENLKKISQIGQKLLWNLTICELDNSLIAFEFQKDLFFERTFTRAYSTLERGMDRKLDVLEADNVRQCHTLINLISEILIRLIVQGVDNHLWHADCIATLARVSTKLKVLCKDPKTFGIRAVNNARDIEAKEEAKFNLGLDMGIVDPGGERSIEDVVSAEPRDSERSRNRLRDFDKFFRGRESKSISSYIIEALIPREAIYNMIALLLWNLSESSRSGLSVGAFEISTLVYKTGFERSAVVLTQDRDGEMIASSSRQILRNTFFAFNNLEKSLKAIKDRLSPSRPPNADADKENPVVKVMWEWSGRGVCASLKPTQLKDSSHVLCLLISACSTHPKVGSMLMQLNRMCNLTTAGEALRQVPDMNYTAIFTIKTKAYDTEREKVTESGEVQPISRSLMARYGLHALAQGIDITLREQQEAWLLKEIRDKLVVIEERQQNLKKLDDAIWKEWQIDERAITIGCWKYAWSVGLACIILVGGGLAIGFSLGQRVKGVDPFNITTFCWAFAAFILVVAKSWRVQDWPWRDFLRGQVVCRSLTELCSVTRTDPQDVLAWLLQNERSTVLETRGPYNKLFRRRSDDGFSIDCTIQLSTMMLSGIIVVEVQTQLGPALVCLNVRPGVEYQAFVHSHDEDDEEWNLACIEPPSKDHPDAVATLLPMHLGWYKVLGVYNVPKREFR